MVVTGMDTSLVLHSVYVLAFGLSAVVCFAIVPKARSVVDADSRRGLIWLLLLCGGWAAAHVGFLLAPFRELQVAFYVLGLVSGFAAIGAWIYFCSAYTGRTYHRRSGFRLGALALFLAVVALKVSNPIHGLYFSASPATEPFAHLAVQHGTLHWLAMGLAYALASVGYFMLLERFLTVGQDTRPLIALVGLTGLPLLADLAGLLSPRLIDMTYEPVGVAAFAVGVLYLYLEEFQAVQLAGGQDEPVLVLDPDGTIREYNRAARTLFPTLAGAIGDDPANAVPALSHAMLGEMLLTVERDDGPVHYHVTETPISAGDVPLGSVLSLEDVTAAEESRRALERQTERLDRFASVVAHDLRNPLNVAEGHLELAQDRIDAGRSSAEVSDEPAGAADGSLAEHLEAAAEALERMEALIDDLLTLARQGQDIDEVETVAIGDLATDCWTTVESQDASLTVQSNPTVDADPDRVRQLLENLFRNAIEHGGDDVTITVGALASVDGFFVEDDGPGIPEEDREEVFEAGMTTNPDGTGFGLAIVSEIVDAHGWSIALTAANDGGARFEIRT
ncbi:sensor histidine kinase [Salinarchaeum laminariae]|uniref:sensor histidine kinase n=1 Tax=Salinarchaeum laminariae TaxID=869888 RepID=UPI0020BFBB88|nr:ATP-binding protein [Salinarchaeum laminariae]